MSVKDISAEELRNLIKNNKSEIEIIDVREPDETNLIKIKDSKLIPLSQFQSRINEIDFSKQVIFICRTGSRSKMISNIISQQLPEAGKISNLRYGIFECYKKAGEENNLQILDKNLVEEYF
ncbi:rhodanese-like domain-containing protein [Candidatus Pacearchaeota archaeon]|nr:rhodanese-like domain-containing protein [Candidatus Pacearchaeota archaeon]